MKKLQLYLAGRHYWTLSDQIFVSGGGFAINVLAARALGIQDYGWFALAQMYVLYGAVIQSALVISPMVTALPQSSSGKEEEELAQGFFAYGLIVAAFAAGATILFGTVVGAYWPTAGLHGLAGSIFCLLIVYQVQDWLRRAAYVRGRARAAALSGMSCVMTQITALISVELLGKGLSVEQALWCLFFGYGVGVLTALSLGGIRPKWTTAWTVFSKNWRSGANYFAAMQFQWVASSGVVMIGAASIGPHAAGAVRAAQNLLGPINVIFQAMENIVPARAVAIAKKSGALEMTKYLKKILKVGGVLLLVFTGLIAAADEWLLVQVYGEGFKGFGILLALQGAYYLLGFFYRLQTSFSRAVGETSPLVYSSAFWAFSSITLSLFLPKIFGSEGVMYSLLVGHLVAVLLLAAWNPSLWRLGKFRSQTGGVS